MQKFNQFRSSAAWSWRRTDRTADGDAAGSGRADGRQIRGRNAADREPRQRDFGGDLADELQPCQLIEGFRAGRKTGTDAEIVRSVEHRLTSLLDRVCRDSDQSVRADDAAGFANGKFFLPHMNSIGLGQYGEVRAIVHDEERVRLARPVADSASGIEQSAVGQFFLAKLHDPHPRFESLSNCRAAAVMAQRFGDEQIQIAADESFASDQRCGHCFLDRVEPVTKLFEVRWQSWVGKSGPRQR